MAKLWILSLRNYATRDRRRFFAKRRPGCKSRRSLPPWLNVRQRYRCRVVARSPRQTGRQVATGEKKHWPGKVFKSVIFSAISLSWCVASGLTGRPALGEHELSCKG